MLTCAHHQQEMPRGRPKKSAKKTTKTSAKKSNPMMNTRKSKNNTTMMLQEMEISMVDNSKGKEIVLRDAQNEWPELPATVTPSVATKAIPTGSIERNRSQVTPAQSTSYSVQRGDTKGDPVNQAQRKLELPQVDVRKQQWNNLFTGNQMASRGMRLNFIAPSIKGGEIVVELDRAEIESENRKWAYALILYVLGDSPTFAALDKFMSYHGEFCNKTTSLLP